MLQKRKASGDPPGTSRPPARMRVATTDDEDVYPMDPRINAGLGRGGERTREEVVPPPLPQPHPLPTAGVNANQAANFAQPAPGQIDYIGRRFVNGRFEMFDRVAVGQEASSPVDRASGSEETLSWSDEAEAPSSENEEGLPTAAEHPQGQRQPPAVQPAVADAQAPPLPNDDRAVIAAAAPAPATAAAEYIWCSACLLRPASVRLVPEMHICHCVPCHFAPSGRPNCPVCDS
ncbi:uncharacterized protein [Triticum aestivum]|uniref:uncharacterized protein n=1 Tax=Triticum aestivum TaxID=4565 RepID=UPI001D016A60|nr:uncharacterized protein LOC123167819 [Triticum aestivum]